MKQKFTLSLLIFSLILNVTFISRKVYLHYNYKPKPVLSTNTSSGLYNQLYHYCPKDSNEIIFLGNSITSAFQIEEYLPDYKIKNRGIWGNTTTDILNRIDDITKSLPDKLFLMIGINDLVKEVPTEKVIENYLLILKKIKKQSPETKIYIQSILPITKYASNYFSGDQNKLNPVIDEVNDTLYNFVKENGLIYIDLNEMFKLNDELNNEYSWDGIHINNNGYKLWLEQIKLYIVNNES